MRVLVVGSGGREHAMVWALSRSPSVDRVFVAPGNPGTADIADPLEVDTGDLEVLADTAKGNAIDLTVVGPEGPLASGIGDVFERRGLRLFGPTRAAAELESSKVFAKEFCLRHGIPTAQARVVVAGEDAEAAAQEFGFPVVLKADGLAAGKGVLIVNDREELAAAIDELFVARRFGSASDRVLVEECLSGTEVSFMVISDGTRIEPIATSHDYKRVGDGDAGPNTGGMGSHSPAYALDTATRETILDTVIMPAVRGMATEGREYRGILYAGLMLTSDGPKVLEFNCRLGDPETQSVLRRLEGDLATTLSAAADGRLVPGSLRWADNAAVCLVLAAEGYPQKPNVGDTIVGIDRASARDGIVVFHAGTRLDGRRLETSGGRVLGVTATGASLAEAVDRVYDAAREIRFDGLHHRTDIGADTLKGMGTSGG